MRYDNFVETQLDEPLLIGATSVTLQPAKAPHRLPPADGGVLVLADSMGSPSSLEIISYAARDGLTLTGLDRGLEGTDELVWPRNSYCYQSLTAGGFESIKQIIDEHVAVPNPHPQYLRAESSVSLDGLASIYITQTGEYTITDYDAFSDYVVQVSAGTASMNGDTITYTAPGVAGPVVFTVFVGDHQRNIELEVLPEKPAAPAITSPETTGVVDGPLLAAGPFELIGPNTDTHAATDWEVWTGPGRTGELVWSSIGNAVDLLSIRMPDILNVSTDYYMVVRYAGETFGYGEWAELAFTTADQFLPTVIGQPFGGGFYAGKVQQADGVYLVIVAPKAAETSLAWKDANTATVGTASLNDGLANSNAMNNAAHAAAQYCRAYNGGGLDDWYLPAKDELEVCYRNLKPDATANNTSSGANTNSVPAAANYTAGSPAQTTAAAFKTGGAEAFTVPDYYWSSTENSATSAWGQRVSDGFQTSTNKNTARLVRPVRRLKI